MLVGLAHMVLDVFTLALSLAVAMNTVLRKALVASASVNLVLSVVISGDDLEKYGSRKA